MHELTSLWNLLRIPPGICVTLLGVEALAITLVPTRWTEKKFVKAVAIILCFLIAFGEISIIRRDRIKSFKQHERDMNGIFDRFGRLEQEIVAFQRNSQAVQRASTLPAENLKRRALDLSNEILQFLINREVPPGYGQGGFGAGPYGGKPSDTTAYDQETLNIFLNVFEPRVAAIRDEFKKRGLSDERFDREYSSPVNAYSIRSIAERIAALAERLPQGGSKRVAQSCSLTLRFFSRSKSRAADLHYKSALLAYQLP